jgi:short-subunit dehydrogenase
VVEPCFSTSLEAAKLVWRWFFKTSPFPGLRECYYSCFVDNVIALCSAPAAVYLIFGATGGIGSALAQRLAKHDGAALVLAGRNQDKLSALSDSLATKPAAGVSTLVCDVTDPKAVEQAVEQAVQAHGSVTGVANCVGSIVLKAAHQTSGKAGAENKATQCMLQVMIQS